MLQGQPGPAGTQVASVHHLGRVWAVPELQRLHAGHAPAVLALELANRGDDFFNQFTERHSALAALALAAVG
jgi:[ribosomal protein S5]-alanine N-acetyltransferase